MRKLNLRVVLFLTLIFALSFGLPFLAFNQMLTNKHEKDDAPIRMAVAFVNEDEGATFNNQEVVFGDEFANSIQKDDEHDWYVVSRGVAENGLDRNAYDMMIVIPNNFSEKAVSIDLEEPEQISLHYKINTSGHEGVRAEAEKTANRLLNEFNQRIIDVYFASIIGNLQEAQDHVGEIVKKEELYTNTYKDSINHPLSDYTNQFQRVRDQTGRSVDHFSSLEDILKGNENNINADVRNNKDSLVRLNNLPRTPKDETSFPMPFSDQFEPFEPPSRNINDVGLDDSQQFKQLQAENDAYNERFSHKDSDKQTHVASVASNDTNGIEAYLNQMNQQVNQIESSIDESIHRDIRPEVEKRLSDSFQEVFDGQDIYIRSLFKDLDRNAHKKIQSQIEQVPSLNVNDINGSGLPKDTTNQLKNAIFVTNKYNQEFSFSPGAPNKSNLLSHQIHQIKNELATTGVTITDSVHISEDQDADQTFYLTVPNEFEVTSLSLKMPNKQEKSYKQHQKIELPAMSKGDFHVRANIKLKDTNQTIDVFKPVTWEWKLEPKEMKNKGSTSTTKKIASLSLHENEGNNNHPVEFRDQNEQGIIVKQMNNNPDKTTETGEENKSSDSIEGNEESSDPDGGREDGDPAENNEDDGRGNDDVSDPNEDDKDDQDEEDEDEEKEDEDKEDEEDEDEEKEDEDKEDKEDEEDDQDEDKNDEEETPPEEITNSYVHHQVTSPLTEDDSTKKLIKAASDTVKDYQQLLSLYELYFGFDMSQPDLKGKLEEGSLSDLSTKNSLHHSLNNKDLSTFLEDHLVDGVIDEIMEEVQHPTVELQTQVNQYNKFVDEIDQDTDQIVEKVIDTSEKAEEINTGVGDILNDLDTQREPSTKQTPAVFDSQDRQDSQDRPIDMSKKENQDHTALIATLDSELTSLLRESETLARQARSNRLSAEPIYQALDEVDKQARDIQKSGVDLVNDAEKLSNNLTDQLVDNQGFADNFAGVLANSRIGDRPNEDLYDFLSSPVDAQNEGMIIGDETFTPYFIVLILFLLSLFTAYVISTYHQKRMERQELFVENQPIIKNNLPVTLITAGIGAVEGIIIGVLSGYLLQMSQTEVIIWIVLVTLMMMSMLLIATYLLRQLKMIGMFLLLVMFSFYLFLTESLGFSFDKLPFIANLRQYSPLQYVETSLIKVSEGLADQQSLLIIFAVLVVLFLLGLVMNLYVLYRTPKKEEMDDEGIVEMD